MGSEVKDNVPPRPFSLYLSLLPSPFKPNILCMRKIYIQTNASSDLNVRPECPALVRLVPCSSRYRKTSRWRTKKKVLRDVW